MLKTVYNKKKILQINGSFQLSKNTEKNQNNNKVVITIIIIT